MRLFNRTTRSVSLTDAGGPSSTRSSGAARHQGGDGGGSVAAGHAVRHAADQRLRQRRAGNPGAAGARLPAAPPAGPDRSPQRGPHRRHRRRRVRHGSAASRPRAERHDRGSARAPRSFAVVATPAYFEAHGRPRVPPDLLGHACIRIRLPNGAPFRWPFEKDGNPVQLDVQGPISLAPVCANMSRKKAAVSILRLSQSQMKAIRRC